MRARALPFLLFLFTVASAQDPDRVPELARRLEAATHDTMRARLRIDIAFNLQRTDPEQALAHLEQARSLARSAGHIAMEAEALSDMAGHFQRRDEFATADSLVRIALRLSAKEPCVHAMALNAQGLILQSQRDNAGALELFLQAHKEGAHCPHAGGRSARAYAVGSVYNDMGRYQEALRYFRECIALDSPMGNAGRLAREFIALGNALSGIGRVDSAHIMYDKAIAAAWQVGDSVLSGYVFYNKAELSMNAGRNAEALKEAAAADVIFQRLGSPAEVLHVGIFHGYLLILNDRVPEAALKLRTCLDLSERLGIGYERARCLRLLADAHKKLGEEKAALEYLEQHLVLKDSLDATAQKERLAEITARFETEKKEKELQTAKANEAEATAAADRLRAQRAIYIGGAIVLGALLVLFISRYRMKRRAAEELERVNAEVMRQKDRAEDSERAKDRFLANVSHEIRTPLNAIMGFTGLLLHEHRDERTTRYLTSIREAGDNLLVVINDVLDLSRIEAGRLQLVKEPFDIRRTVTLCAEILHHRAEEQGDTLRTHVAPDVPPWVLGDSARVLQILLNLTGNALKFTTNGAVEVEVERDPKGIVFTVRDNGIGIPPDKQASIFERFTQVDVNDQRKYGGTGLGLSITKELVDLHGGTITVQSTPGAGTSFTVVLPLAPADAPSTATVHAAVQPSGSLAGRTILVAEDNEMNALVTTETLRHHYPYAHAEVVRTGQAALDAIAADEDNDIALVLMDVQMPVMDGMTASRRIRTMNGAAAQLPIIALTASVLPSDLSRCLDAGMNACVPKPFKAEELLRAIGQLTGDHGVAPGVGFDANDPQVALYRWLVPQRLKALRAAIANDDMEEALRIVHALRPQLVERDRTTFDAPTAHLLRTGAQEKDIRDRMQQLIHMAESTLA